MLSDDPASLEKVTLWMALCMALYVLSLVVCRISGLLFYARLNTMPRFVFYLRLTFIYVVAAFIIQVVVTIARCFPVSPALWEDAERGEKCFGVVTVSFNTVLTLTADLLILFLPTNIILSMKATWERKTVLTIILSFGVL